MSPLVAKGLAHVVGTPSATSRVQAVVAFKPRNAVLLHWLAVHSSGRPGMSNAEIQRLFAPRPATVAAVRAYLSANGLSVIDSSDMSLVVSGTAAAADRAFGVGLRMYRDARGTTYQAPSGNVRLPRGIAAVVQSVDGLDSSLRAHSHHQIAKGLRGRSAGAPPKLVPHSVGGCGKAQTKQSNAGRGYLPGDLAAAGAYNHDSLISGGNDGAGQRIGFVEFSGYVRADPNHFKSCFTGITGTLDPDVAIAGGASDRSGQVEVNLDIEVAMGAAPAATWQVYKAPNNLALLPTMLHKMRDNGVNIVSDSWGLCELFVPVKLTSVENTALELTAAAGLSFYSASGDDGSADCRASNPGANFLAIDDPSGQPFATAVGGTSLHVAPSTVGPEKAWSGSGGGISINWPRPEYQQAGPAIPTSSGSFCLGGPDLCRVTPDIAMDAAPGTGYWVYSRVAGAAPAWILVGGTSAAAPLIAGITADANESAGQNLGFANPFFYQEPGSTFNDITQGSNGAFAAAAGFDFVTGLGSVKAAPFATDLATYVATPITVDTTILTINHPLDRKRVKKGARVLFAGRLRNVDTPGPIANRQIIVIGNSRIIAVTRSRNDGTWQVRARVSKRTTWHAIFMGSDTQKPDLSPSRLIRMRH